jgi:hypothetical protein
MSQLSTKEILLVNNFTRITFQNLFLLFSRKKPRTGHWSRILRKAVMSTTTWLKNSKPIIAIVLVGSHTQSYKSKRAKTLHKVLVKERRKTRFFLLLFKIKNRWTKTRGWTLSKTRSLHPISVSILNRICWANYWDTKRRPLPIGLIFREDQRS